MRVLLWLAGAVAMAPAPALAQSVPPPPQTAAPTLPTRIEAAGRSDENAMRQAEDAFGTSVGRESIGLYNSGSVRGFSPIAASNARIEGLYFDQIWGLTSRIRRSTNIRVGVSAQGYPFPAPTGIVDYSFRKPGDTTKLGVVIGGDSYGNAYVEADLELPLTKRLSLGVGASGYLNSYYNGTDAYYHNAAVMLRWSPIDAVEIVPFWHRSEGYDDEAGPIFLPAGATLPPRVQRRRFNGPAWADYRGSAINYGTLVTVQPGSSWTIRAGLFRSVFDDQQSFSHLLLNVTPEGAANRLIIADPPIKRASTSGELRVSRELAEGPRVHTLHLSIRSRNRTRRYAGSDLIDYGPTTITALFPDPEPVYAFTPQTRDRVTQWTAGIAYEGRWRGIGELGFSVQKTDYRKQLNQPGLPESTTNAAPWLFNITAAAYLTRRLALYGGYTRGLEESGVAPDNAANRNELLPAIQTSQRDIGLRYVLTPEVKIVAGLFDVRKPYFNLDAANRFELLGDVKNQGIELSIAGNVTKRLNLVAGAVLSRPQVTGEGVRLGRVGARPVGLTNRSIEFNLDWRLPWKEGVSLDMTASHSGAITATVDNRVSIPERTLVDIGGRYRFKLGRNPATLRVALSNLFDVEGFDLRGSGAYDIIPGRVASAYLSVDF
ncbi:MAG: TonB-dependent receptor [Sphingobium sp.]|nr:TonB-dependent receptor [Sphingobium sp.]